MTIKNSQLAACGRAVAKLLVALAVLSLAACAATPQNEGDKAVKRAEARWEAVVAGDLEAAYAFYSPGFRSATSLIDFAVYMRMRRVKYLGATYREHACEESRCTIDFDVDYSVANPVPGLSVYEGQNVVQDTWVKTNGQWWYLPEK